MFLRVSLSNIKFSQKLLVLTVILASFTQVWFPILNSVFLVKLGVYCLAKRQNKLEKKSSLRIFTGRATEWKEIQSN